MTITLFCIRQSPHIAVVAGILSEAYDKDGDGHISPSELVRAAKLTIHTRKSNSKLRKALGFTVLLVAVAILSRLD